MTDIHAQGKTDDTIKTSNYMNCEHVTSKKTSLEILKCKPQPLSKILSSGRPMAATVTMVARTRSSQSHSSMDGRGSHGTPALTREPLAVHGS